MEDTKNVESFEDQEEIAKASEIVKQVDELERKHQERKDANFVKNTTQLIETLNEALDTYAKLLEERAAKYGEMSFECGPLAALYGRALLKRAKLESNVALYSAVTKALSEANIVDQHPAEQQIIAENLQSGKLIQFDEDAEEEASENNEEQSDEEGNENGISMDVLKDAETTLDDAYVILELAKNILTAKLQSLSSEEEKLTVSALLSKVHSDVGDVLNETDNFDEAIAQFEMAIQLLKDDHYDVQAELEARIANTMSLAQRPTEECIKRYERAATLLEKHIAKHSEIANEAKKNLEDMLLTIEELKESAKEEPQLLQQKSESTSSSSDKPVYTLVPKRKRDDNNSTTEEPPTKVAKQE